MQPPDGHRELQYDGMHCSLKIEAFDHGVIVLRINGADVGEFGHAPMDALSDWLQGEELFEFFIDARDARGPSIEVSGDWAQWLGRHKRKLRSVTMLTGSRFVKLTAEFVRRFAELEDLMRICTQPDVFDNALEEALRPTQS